MAQLPAPPVKLLILQYNLPLLPWMPCRQCECGRALRAVPFNGSCTAFLPASMSADSVNAEVYCALRRLFIERLDLDRGFDFHG